MGRRKRTVFDESAIANTATYWYYVDRLQELAISMFQWKNLPENVSERYIETQLYLTGRVVYFNDEILGNLCLNVSPRGNFDLNGEPVNRRAYCVYNSYQKELTVNDSVIVWNNLMRKSTIPAIREFAYRLYNMDRTIDVNVNAQKTPVLILADESQRLTMLQIYKDFDGNAPVIFGNKNLDLKNVTCLKTDAPYVADKIYELKTNVWNEALTYLGISNVSIQKKERLVTDEVQRNQGGTLSSRNSRFKARQTAVDKINKMFGTNIEVEYNEDITAEADEITRSMGLMKDGDDNE